MVNTYDELSVYTQGAPSQLHKSLQSPALSYRRYFQHYFCQDLFSVSAVWKYYGNYFNNKHKTELNLETKRISNELKIVVDFSVEMIRFQISYFISAFRACVLITPSYLKIS